MSDASGERYSRGGFIPGPPVKITLDPEECVIARPDGVWRCVRADHDHPFNPYADLDAGVERMMRTIREGPTEGTEA